MDLLQLEHFLAVVEERTFTRAAERVCRTQPAVSQSIKQLEEEVGAPLFARDVHEVSLTEAGRVLADYARTDGHLRDDAMRQVSELQDAQGGHADHRRARIGGRLSAAGAAPALPAEVSRHQGRHPPQPAERDSASGDGPRSRRRFRQGRAGVSRAAVGRSARRRDDAASPRRTIRSPRAPRSACATSAPSSSSCIICAATTADRILRLFEQHAHPLPHRRRAVELREHQELRAGEKSASRSSRASRCGRSSRDGTLVRIPLRELSMPRRTLMVYRDRATSRIRRAS